MISSFETDDDDWDRPPTALEAAHYDALLTRQANEASERARKVFGQCLLQLTQLGMKEAKARPMLGKWRASAKDDALLIRVIQAAHDNGTPDPVSYVTKALAAAKTRTAKTVNLQKSEWTLLGWEQPRMSGGKLRFKNNIRGQVWRDPFGKLTVLPAPTNITPPTVEDDPGVSIEKAAA